MDREFLNRQLTAAKFDRAPGRCYSIRIFLGGRRTAIRIRYGFQAFCRNHWHKHVL